MEGHYPIEYTRTDGKKGLYCNCGGPLPCPHFVPGEFKAYALVASTLPTTKDGLASAMHTAWRRYTDLFGEPPHGTLPQIKALVELMPTPKSESSTDSTTHENPKSDKLTSCPTDLD
jgi:hypothetical protein